MGKLRSILISNNIDVNSIITNVLSMTNGAYFKDRTTLLYRIETHSTATYLRVSRNFFNNYKLVSILNGKNTTFKDKAIVVDGSIDVSSVNVTDIDPVGIFYNEEYVYIENNFDADYVYIEAIFVNSDESNIAESFILELESMLFGFLMRDNTYVYKAIQRIDTNLMNNIAENKRPSKITRKAGRIKPCHF